MIYTCEFQMKPSRKAIVLKGGARPHGLSPRFSCGIHTFAARIATFYKWQIIN